MALPVSELTARRHLLTVIEGGRLSWRQEEARAELLAFFDEVARDAEAIQTVEAQGQMPSLRVIHLAGRIGSRASAAKAEYLELTTDPGEAA
jgi:hypothetical protein